MAPGAHVRLDLRHTVGRFPHGLDPLHPIPQEDMPTAPHVHQGSVSRPLEPLLLEEGTWLTGVVFAFF